ncbi:hypothetical protein SacxiDRAFT_0811 [Saccharomonospora xinjiangensis XJ-54]|uniref:Rho termination factor N-terminal domain-containing protein n=2 Tax=Saccharomonospora TaxID=1851 RepID=I0UYX3_9PSEU|nr:hypothetical protein SacxiDRAFT_0811 [Saccharomonospora xinjiangensis XJ-54]
MPEPRPDPIHDPMPDTEDLHDKTLGELADTARREGIPFVAHMSQSELVEAIAQQREANTHAPPPPRNPLDDDSTGTSATSS